MITVYRMRRPVCLCLADRWRHGKIHIGYPQRNDIRPAENLLTVIVFLGAGAFPCYQPIEVKSTQLRSQIVTSDNVC